MSAHALRSGSHKDDKNRVTVWQGIFSADTTVSVSLSVCCGVLMQSTCWWDDVLLITCISPSNLRLPDRVYIPAIPRVSSVESHRGVYWYNCYSNTFVWLVLVYWWLGRHGLENTTVLESSHTWTLLRGTPHCFACTVNNSDDVSVDNEENTINANYCENYLSPAKCKLLSAWTVSDLLSYQMCWWLLE